MLYLQLCYEFFKAGLFAIGGGLATLPFLSDIAERRDWFTQAELMDMIAISESTPGAIGINMATYAGFSAGGPLGGLVATLALITPSIIIILIVARFLGRFSESVLVQDALRGLRPASTGLIAAAGFEVLVASVLSWELFVNSRAPQDLFRVPALIMFSVLLFATNKVNWHPIVFLAASAVVGIVLQM